MTELGRGRIGQEGQTRPLAADSVGLRLHIAWLSSSPPFCPYCPSPSPGSIRKLTSFSEQSALVHLADPHNQLLCHLFPASTPTSPRQVDLKAEELLYKVLVPFSRPHEYVKEFKQSPRREDDIAIVNAGMRVRLEPAADGSWVVAEAAFAFGGVAAKALMAEQVAQAVLGKPWTQKTLVVGRGGGGEGRLGQEGALYPTKSPPVPTAPA